MTEHSRKDYSDHNPADSKKSLSPRSIESPGTSSNEEALRRSEERLKLAQAAAGAGIWDVNLVTGEQEWSHELYSLFGLDPGEINASFENWKSIIHPDDREIVWKNLGEAIAKKEPLDLEYRIIYSSGEVHWLRAIGNTIYSDEGQPLRAASASIFLRRKKRSFMLRNLPARCNRSVTGLQLL